MRVFGSRNSKRKQFGQGMTEYIIIVAMIALASIAGVKYFGEGVQGAFSGMTAVLGGGTPAAGAGIAATAAGKTATDAVRARTLSDYHQ